jgi:hypothetical protein
MAGPTVALNGAATAQPTFTAPSVTADTLFTFQLTVGDGTVEGAPDTVNITVRGGGSSSQAFTTTLKATLHTIRLARRAKMLSVKLTVKNTGKDPVTVTAAPMTVDGTGSVELRSVPRQSSATLRPKRTRTFQWRYKATEAGTVVFTGAVTSTQGVGSQATANVVTIAE